VVDHNFLAPSLHTVHLSRSLLLFVLHCPAVLLAFSPVFLLLPLCKSRKKQGFLFASSLRFIFTYLFAPPSCCHLARFVLNFNNPLSLFLLLFLFRCVLLLFDPLFLLLLYPTLFLCLCLLLCIFPPLNLCPFFSVLQPLLLSLLPAPTCV